MSLKRSGEMYLETILILSQRGEPVHAVDVAKHMNFSKPSVSRALGLLRDGGYLEADAQGHLILSPSGAEVAHKIYERHRLMTEFLVYLGVDRDVAVEDACKMEHDISEESFEAFKVYARKLGLI
ncbi:MAG: metal-dependent transcriptional regulator [Clostridiales bacterium]|nr:metal-dependent transcriptional regulator [Clostridiales bacterium]